MIVILRRESPSLQKEIFDRELRQFYTLRWRFKSIALAPERRSERKMWVESGRKEGRRSIHGNNRVLQGLQRRYSYQCWYSFLTTATCTNTEQYRYKDFTFNERLFLWTTQALRSSSEMYRLFMMRPARWRHSSRNLSLFCRIRHVYHIQNERVPVEELKSALLDRRSRRINGKMQRQA